MKILYRILILVLIAGSSISCNFLDVVPDERTTEADTYAGRNNGIGYLYSCYAYLPNPASTPAGLDLLTGDEVITAFEHETFAAFPKGNYSASSPVISYWNTFFQGLRQCYMFMDHIDDLPDTSDAEKRDYRGQAKFLIAYYHFLLSRAYGPILLVKETPSPNMTLADYPGRVPYDEAINWISDLLDEAAEDLPAKRDIQSQFGLATSVMAKAVKAKLWLYAASPLFNGNSAMYSDFKDTEGVQLMPTTYDAKKWVTARNAIKDAIDHAEANGHRLYVKDNYQIAGNSDNKFPPVGVVRRMRTLTLDWKGEANPEVLFADTRGEGYYDIQLKSTPKTSVEQGANGVSLTWAMLNRFYTKNGLPWDEDPAYKNSDKMAVVAIDDDHADYGKVGALTPAFNLNREPRFYAWVGFHNGYFEILNAQDNPYPASYMPERGRVLLDFTKNGNQGRQNRNNNYAPAGNLNKKGTDPNHNMTKGGPRRTVYPWPVIRLADLYLAYAEACVETNELDITKTYLNKVRVRAGVPTIETSWSGVAELTQAKLRQIVRQERMIELYLENQNFWDMRRWLLAEEAFGKKVQGFNIEGTTVQNYANLTEISFERKFTSPRNYLLPIPSADVNRNPKLTNNPGY